MVVNMDRPHRSRRCRLQGQYQSQVSLGPETQRKGSQVEQASQIMSLPTEPTHEEEKRGGTVSEMDEHSRTRIINPALISFSACNQL
jgi:hypothetical protein